MKTLVSYTDGGSRGNPGHSAIGVYSITTEGVILKHGEYIGISTNNVAEYMALFGAVDAAIRGGYEALFVYSDSQIMVRQIKGQYFVRDEKLKRIYDQIIQMLPKLKEFHITHIPREQNTDADKIVNEVLDGIARQNLPAGTRKDSIFQRRVSSMLRLRNARPSYRHSKRCA